MIYINKLKESDVNRYVIYSTHNAIEEGRITSWNNSFIFVDFDNSGRGQGCRPQDLNFVTEKLKKVN